MKILNTVIFICSKYLAVKFA